ANESVLNVTAVFLNSPAIKAEAHSSHVFLHQGGTGIGGVALVAARSQTRTVHDSVAILARRFEPEAFDKSAHPQSSVIGLIIDEKFAVVRHSRVDVSNDQQLLQPVYPHLFPDIEQPIKAPFMILSLIDGAYGSRNVQVVGIFLKKPSYAVGINR